jgi:photosystem II protein
MISSIQFIKGIEEKRLPLIRLTKSKNGETGTATFLFFSPSLFSFSHYSFKIINGISLIWDGKEIVSNDLKIVFKEGKPFLLKAIFLFKKKQEWFLFLNFMNSYSKQTGLFFSETNLFLK